MKIDTSVWRNKKRLTERIMNLTKTVMSLSAINGFYMITQKQWILLGLNILFFLTMLPVYISWTKFQKEPPMVEEE